ncbi:MAG: DUF4872 domain-containing protein [Anaerolineae bacterium]|nr:MAG: DUF4872 domain-containing protein [Anaerolineae bacterium]
MSGGIAFGYFIFQYEGHLPHMVVLTRNTFDPFQTILQRLGVVQDILQTTTPAKGLRNLLDVLDSGRPAIVWADMVNLPYNALQRATDYWAMMPLVVFGHDGEHAFLADRSSQPLTVTAAELEAARARVKKDKFRVLSIDPPRPEKLASAVSNGIWDCIRLFTEKPPRGTTRNFGLSAMQHWASMLTNTRNPQSWARALPPGPEMFAALSGHGAVPGLYSWVQAWGDGGGERARYAKFLEEAAVILERPALKQVAPLFRKSHAAWAELADLALPKSVPALAEARRLHDKRASLFWERGSEALDELLALAEKQRELSARMKREFPLDEAQAADLRAALSAQVLKIHDIEKQAVQAMQDAMA